MKGLLDAIFIYEANYTKWLSNFVIVMKTLRKWGMYVDYIDLNRACPKYSYPFPDIDNLANDSAVYNFISFMDA